MDVTSEKSLTYHVQQLAPKNLFYSQARASSKLVCGFFFFFIYICCCQSVNIRICKCLNNNRRYNTFGKSDWMSTTDIPRHVCVCGERDIQRESEQCKIACNDTPLFMFRCIRSKFCISLNCHVTLSGHCLLISLHLLWFGFESFEIKRSYDSNCFERSKALIDRIEFDFYSQWWLYLISNVKKSEKNVSLITHNEQSGSGPLFILSIFVAESGGISYHN